MSPSDGLPRRASPVRGGSDRYEALLEVLEEQAAREPDDRFQPRRRPRAKRVALGLLAVIAAWLWLLPPGWLGPAAAAPVPLAEEEAALRFTMYLQAQRIRAYELARGGLPSTLEEAGESVEGVTYRLVRPGLYELVGRTERLELTYRSDEPLRTWVGSGANVVNETLIR